MVLYRRRYRSAWGLIASCRARSRGPAAAYHVPEVETGEKLEDLGGIDGIAGGGREQGLVEAAQFGGESGALALGESGGGARAEPFDGADELEEARGRPEG